MASVTADTIRKQREFAHTVGGITYTVLLPRQIDVDRAFRTAADNTTAVEDLTMAAVVGWQGPRLSDLGYAEPGAEIDLPLPCTPDIVAELLGTRTDDMRELCAQVSERFSTRRKALEAATKNSAAG